MSERTYGSIFIHPADENGTQEMWEEYTECLGDKTFDSDSIIGWLYRIDDIWVWMNEAGHPAKVFVYGKPDMSEWLLSFSSRITWDTKALT